MFDIVKRLKLQVWMFLAMLTAVGSKVFVAEMTFNGILPYYSGGIISFVLLLIFLGAAYGFFARVFARIVFSFGSRMFFRRFNYVPNYNLRKYPYTYSLFCALFLAFTCVYNIFATVLNILAYVFPTAYYVLLFVTALLRIGTFVGVWFVIRPTFEDWQLKGAFISYAVPSALVLILCILGGM